ncbi:hypothetical protein D3H65_17175 [Paraflavitalea soli]|uniref:Uncharacterized protein n=1 Tax=Paraflavitalea soli TaxID=2315862 RepID=A0A3B7MZ77_9BACT|nr:hypothetical protein D3H65_17175 [Paraflavitalea soli]
MWLFWRETVVFLHIFNLVIKITGAAKSNLHLPKPMFYVCYELLKAVMTEKEAWQCQTNKKISQLPTGRKVQRTE